MVLTQPNEFCVLSDLCGSGFVKDSKKPMDEMEGAELFFRFSSSVDMHRKLRKNGAGDRIRTGDVHLGRVAFYH